MTETRIKTTLMLIGEALVIWYGMGTPVPTNFEETIKLAVAILAITYTAWKNHDFTVEADTYTKLMHQEKAMRDYNPTTTEEPEDAEVSEDE